MVFVVLIIGGLRIAHRGAIWFVASRQPPVAFPEIRLHKGLRKADVLRQLGPPDGELQQASPSTESAVVTVLYRRGANALELSFRDDTLDSWIETHPGNFEGWKQRPTLTPECCGQSPADVGSR